jgi:hypothetical protein
MIYGSGNKLSKVIKKFYLITFTSLLRIVAGVRSKFYTFCVLS